MESNSSNSRTSTNNSPDNTTNNNINDDEIKNNDNNDNNSNNNSNSNNDNNNNNIEIEPQLNQETDTQNLSANSTPCISVSSSTSLSSYDSSSSSCGSDSLQSTPTSCSLESESSPSKCSLLEQEFADLDLSDHNVDTRNQPPGLHTKYICIGSAGQKKYFDKHNKADISLPKRCEVFIGRIPRNCMEEELIPLFESSGEIYEFRLMMDYSGTNRGFGFCVYKNSSDAKNSIRNLNGFQIRPNHKLGVCMSVDNRRLFVGGIPKRLKKQEIFDEISMVTDDVVNIIVYPARQDKTKNRGFAFVEFKNHRAAAMARKKLLNNKIELWGQKVAVDWAEPENDVDDETMSQVKNLFVRNLMLTTSEQNLIEVFSEFGVVERVKKIQDHAFIHMQTKDQAKAAVYGLNHSQIDGVDVEVSLAKPVDRETYQQHKLARQQAAAFVSNQQQQPTQQQQPNQQQQQQQQLPQAQSSPNVQYVDPQSTITQSPPVHQTQQLSQTTYTPLVGYIPTTMQDGFTIAALPASMTPQAYSSEMSAYQTVNKPKNTPSTGLSSLFRNLRGSKKAQVSLQSIIPSAQSPPPSASLPLQHSGQGTIYPHHFIYQPPPQPCYTTSPQVDYSSEQPLPTSPVPTCCSPEIYSDYTSSLENSGIYKATYNSAQPQLSVASIHPSVKFAMQPPLGLTSHTSTMLFHHRPQFAQAMNGATHIGALPNTSYCAYPHTAKSYQGYM